MKKSTKKQLDLLFSSLSMTTTAILSCLANQAKDEEVFSIMSELKDRIDVRFSKLLNK